MTGAERDGLIQLTREARQPGWWHSFRDVLPNPYEVYIGLEAGAASIRNFEPVVVPGLLQTADYARETFRNGPRELDPDEVQRRVEVRLARQQILARDDRPRLWAVIDEAVLHRAVATSRAGQYVPPCPTRRRSPGCALTSRTRRSSSTHRPRCAMTRGESMSPRCSRRASNSTSEYLNGNRRSPAVQEIIPDSENVHEFVSPHQMTSQATKMLVLCQTRYLRPGSWAWSGSRIVSRSGGRP